MSLSTCNEAGGHQARLDPESSQRELFASRTLEGQELLRNCSSKRKPQPDSARLCSALYKVSRVGQEAGRQSLGTRPLGTAGCTAPWASGEGPGLYPSQQHFLKGPQHKQRWTVQKPISVSCPWDRRKAPPLQPVIMSSEPVLANGFPLSSHPHPSVSRYQVDM